jgi:DNA primase large subunit
LGTHISTNPSDTLKKYPFLPQVRDYIVKAGLDFTTILELQSIRERAKHRIEASFSLEKRYATQPDRHSEIELASYPVAIMLAAATEDKQLIERFALSEAQQVNLFLNMERNLEVIIEIAKAFSWQIKSDASGTWIQFAKYLKNVSSGRLSHNPKWKLVNRSVDKGWVAVTPQELKRLLQEEVKERIVASAKQKIDNLPEEIQKDIDEIKAEFIKNKPNFVEYDLKIYAKETEYPPCVVQLLKRAKEGKHLSHTERFTLVTYLINQKISIESIVSLFSNVSDFKVEKTRYQVENLAGKAGGRTEPYLTYNCSTLQSHGVCSKEIVPDKICRRIRNPLRYHLFAEKAQ